MTKTTGQPPRRPGRPTKDEELKRALGEMGCDPSAIDPLRILASIAADGSMPPTARVTACKVLLGVHDQDPAEDQGDAARLNERAAALMRRAN